MSIWTSLLGAETRYYDAGGISTRSIEAGSGDSVIFLHGIGGHAEAFARNVVPFGRAFNARSIDYLGHGLTGTIGEPLTKEAFVKHLTAFMDAAGIKRAHLVGESLGGWIAMWAAMLAPERVASVVYVVGAKLEVPVDDDARRRTEAGLAELKRLSREFAENPSRERVRARLDWLFYRPERDVSEELVDLRWALYQRQTNGKQIVTLLTTPDPAGDLTPERLARVTHPVLVLWTDHNPSVTVEHARAAMNYLPNAELTVMEDCGHWPQWEHTETFNDLVTAYLGRR